ncbi:NUDIX domain-containing protein [Falsigemmobacter faecalis]|nr:NUDIX domain-containing protein [Falsigemmobacter faecalis]
MTSLFLHGPLARLEGLSLVLGHPVAVGRARLAGFEAHAALPGHWPALAAAEAAQTEGLELRDPSEADLARIDWLAACFGQARLPLPDGREALLPLHPAAAPAVPQPPGHEEVVTEALRDLMADYQRLDLPLTVVRWDMMLRRAASRLRALGQEGAKIRRDARPGDVAVRDRRVVYANYFSVEEYDLRHSRFDGGESPEINRAAFISSDAATVLPYDPKRDRVLVVEQIRSGPLARGAENPWLLEPIAGRVDAFETPEDCARREAEEEAGLTLDRLIEAARYYPSPGAKAEFLYSYIALCDLPDDLPRLGGLASEAEDIRAHLLPFDALMARITTPEFASGPLILSALWLAGQRDRLRAAG